MDVSDWANYSNGARAPASNPKYCYEWSYRSDDLVVLNIWHASLSADERGLKCDLNLRRYAGEIEKAQDMPWLQRESKLVWARRARSMDSTLQHADFKKLPIRVVVCDGKMSDFTAGDTEADEVKWRLLDPADWTIESYDKFSGDARLRRLPASNRAPVDHAAADVLRAEWNAWIRSDSALQEWNDAAAGIKELFPGWPGGGISKGFPKEEKDAYWFQLQKPLPGVHLIAFMLDRTLTAPKVSLRIWVNDNNSEIYSRFAQARPFSISGHPTVQYVRQQPDAGFKSQLATVGVTVTGVLHSVDCSLVGRPGAHALKQLFSLFSQYAIACHNETVQAASAPEGPDSGAARGSNPWDEDEAALAAVEAMDLSLTEKLVLAKARINQSGYRKMLLDRWGGKCSITGFPHADYLLASHILPWSKCESARDRWSPDNGLLLPPGLDRAFELGDIGFDDRGKMLFSKRGLNVDTQLALGLRPNSAIRNFYDYPGLKKYLLQHREIHKLRLSL